LFRCVCSPLFEKEIGKCPGSYLFRKSKVLVPPISHRFRERVLIALFMKKEEGKEGKRNFGRAPNGIYPKKN
jgi:hypothetical protein